MNRKLTPLGVKFWWNCPWVVVGAEEILWNQACFGLFKTMNYAYKTLMKYSVGQTIGQKQQSLHHQIRNAQKHFCIFLNINKANHFMKKTQLDYDACVLYIPEDFKCKTEIFRIGGNFVLICSLHVMYKTDECRVWLSQRFLSSSLLLLSPNNNNLLEKGSVSNFNMHSQWPMTNFTHGLREMISCYTWFFMKNSRICVTIIRWCWYISDILRSRLLKKLNSFSLRIINHWPLMSKTILLPDKNVHVDAWTCSKIAFLYILLCTRYF